MEKSDLELIIAYEEGDPLAIDLLVKRYLSPVYGLIFRLMGNREEAEDLTQDTFMKAWKHLSSFDKGRNFKTWIFRIARNNVIDYARKKKPFLFSSFGQPEDGIFTFEDLLVDAELLPDEVFEKKENEAALEKILLMLSVDERTIIELHHRDNLGFEEIGEVMNKPMNTVKSQYRRSLQKIRQQLHQKGDSSVYTL